MAGFPFVPDVPGVPPLLRDPANPISLPTLMLVDTFGGFGLPESPTWGIYRGAERVVVADTVVSFGYKQEWAVADYPVERGGFESYDKVDIPYDARVQFATGGSEQDKAAMLASIKAIKGDLNLYDVVTPEDIYTGVNVVHVDYRQTAKNGVGVLVVDVWLLEIREIGSDQANAKAPSGAPSISGGLVQSIGSLLTLPGIT